MADQIKDMNKNSAFIDILAVIYLEMIISDRIEIVGHFRFIFYT